MARFMGHVRGQRGEATRLGSEKSGLRVTANGWDAGVLVEAVGRIYGDEFHIYATGGSGGSAADRFIATVAYDSGTGEITIRAAKDLG